MVILRTSPASPFGRKVALAASILGLDAIIQMEPTNTEAPEDAFLNQNSLGKIPVLITEDGQALYDSRVIVDYLDHRVGGGVIVPQDATRFEALRLQALAEDGLCEATLQIVYEKRFRPEEKWYQPWLNRQWQKATRSLDKLEAAPPTLTSKPDVGIIGLSCALGYSTCASTGSGARITRASSHGSTNSPRRFPLSSGPG
ncbi:glutathione S-transferase N-terminal domain-containing protein [Breoghania sp.]|uniref:glutathione S-transferase n=1 Tax=Breoghania sp. TaxID=2065378 RepID=UPI0032046443